MLSFENLIVMSLQKLYNYCFVARRKGYPVYVFCHLDVWKPGKPKLVADAHPWKFLGEKITPCSQVTSAFAFSSNVKNAFYSNK